jgi:hypothetical protein
MGLSLTLTGHNLYSPSAAHRWMACPASWAAERLVPEVPGGFAARHGTAVHDVAAKIIRDCAEPESFIGTEVHGMPIAPVDIEPLRVYTDLVQTIAAPTDNVLFTEYRVQVTSVHPDLGGTVDAAVVEPYHLTIFDLKFGMGVKVEATENPQGAIYALGMLDNLPEQTQARVGTVNIVIVQPRWHDEDDRVRIWATSKRELHQWRDDILKPAIAATRKSQLTFKAGPHCRFCRYKHLCPTLEAHERQIVTMEHDGLPNEILADLLYSIPQVESRILALRELALGRAKQGEVIPGYHLEEQYSNRKWVDEEGASLQLVEHLEPEDIYSTHIRSPAQIEKELGKARKHLMPPTTKEITGMKLVQDTKPKVPNLPAWAL